jgi:hypothetical protein
MQRTILRATAATNALDRGTDLGKDFGRYLYLPRFPHPGSPWSNALPAGGT